MNTRSLSLKSFLAGLIVSLFVFSLFVPAFQAQAAIISTGCGEATGTPTALGSTSLTDSFKNWQPANRWVGGTVIVTVTITSSGAASIHKNIDIQGSGTNTITVAAWNPVLPVVAFTLKTYSVTAKENACTVASVDYSCLQLGDAGFCKGPCAADTDCAPFQEAPFSWAAAKCTGSSGSCVELPSQAQRLSTGPTTGSGLLATVDLVTNWVFAIFIVLAIIFVLLAAFQFVTSGSDAKKIEEARQKLIWAAVGVIIALLAKGLVPVVRSIVGG